MMLLYPFFDNGDKGEEEEKAEVEEEEKEEQVEDEEQDNSIVLELPAILDVVIMMR